MATWTLADNGRLRQLNGGGLDFDTPGGNGFKIALVTSAYTPNQNTHDFWDDASANEVSGTGYTAGGNVLNNPSVSMDGSGNITIDGDDPATWAQDAAGFTNARRAVLIRDTGVAATSEIVAYSDDFGADRGNVAGPYSIQLDAAGIITSAR